MSDISSVVSLLQYSTAICGWGWRRLSSIIQFTMMQIRPTLSEAAAPDAKAALFDLLFELLACSITAGLSHLYSTHTVTGSTCHTYTRLTLSLRSTHHICTRLTLSLRSHVTPSLLHSAHIVTEITRHTFTRFTLSLRSHITPGLGSHCH